MIEVNIDNLNESGQIVLMQDVALSWRQNICLISVIIFVVGSIGIIFAMLGAWLILPFAGIEVMLLVGLFHYWYKNNNKMEVLKFSRDKMTIERGVSSPEQIEQFERFWLKAEFPNNSDHWYMTKVILRHRNDSFEIGKFLNADDKKLLVKHISLLLPTLR